MEKLAAGGMRSNIDTGMGRGGGGGGAAVQDGKRRKRRRKIITGAAGEKGPKKPTSAGRGRTKEPMIETQMEMSSTIRRRGKPGIKGRRDRQELSKAVVKKIRLGEHVAIRELSAQAGLKSSDIIGFLMKEFEILATINQVVDQEIGGLHLRPFRARI